MSVPRFWREIQQRYTLNASHCTVCDAVHFPPRSICPTCRRASVGKIDHVRLAGRGRVVEWTRVHRPAPGYEMQVPYLVALIQSEEGPLILGQVVDTDTIEVGDEVEAAFRRIGADGDSGVIHYGTKWRPVPVAGDGLLEEE